MREREGERREEEEEGREGGRGSLTYTHQWVVTYVPFILQIEEEILNCQSICHNIDAPK